MPPRAPHAVSSQLYLELFAKACLLPMRCVGVGAPVSGKHGGIYNFEGNGSGNGAIPYYMLEPFHSTHGT